MLDHILFTHYLVYSCQQKFLFIEMSQVFVFLDRDQMGNSEEKSLDNPAISQRLAAAEPTLDSKPKKKICCACPETKKLRDECIVEHGEAACEKWIQAHLQCLRAEGFKV
ncbi:cytochrome c oxidase copper chaperone 1 [Canna indica]|uniref:Cytochrome c oxidase copper chaperone 1 n=1 Tax=Canna indica TaxID=4628 RepID=A0AAQ3Q511_9LILI|nr:cytochrome c oxidase copper chaperone 1 [Canna indica]